MNTHIKALQDWQLKKTCHKHKDKKIEDRLFTLFEDGSVFSHPFTNDRGHSFEGRFLKQGKLCGRPHSKVTVNKKTYNLPPHRVVAEVCLSDWDDSRQVDHINGNPMDNRPCNLRMVTARGNHRAHVKCMKNASSKYRGVFLNKANNKWRSVLMGKHLGFFKHEASAALAYDRAAEAAEFYQEALNRNNFPELQTLTGA
jgi:hypothetical protein